MSDVSVNCSAPPPQGPPGDPGPPGEMGLPGLPVILFEFLFFVPNFVNNSVPIWFLPSSQGPPGLPGSPGLYGDAGTPVSYPTECR